MVTLRPCEMDVQKAATLSLKKIEESLPATLLTELEKVGKSLSVPWVGILVGSLTPIQYVMGYSDVELEDSDWSEPTILWSLMHMPSGTRKSLIYKFVNDLIAGSCSNTEDGDGEHTPYKVNETTFEKLGLTMASNEGKVVWYFDEGRHFLASWVYTKKDHREMNPYCSRCTMLANGTTARQREYSSLWNAQT